MTDFERMLLEQTRCGEGTGTSIGPAYGEGAAWGRLHITYSCPTPGCKTSTESYGLIRFDDPDSRDECTAIKQTDASQIKLCNLHGGKASGRSEAMENAQVAEQEEGRLHIIHMCMIEGCTTSTHSYGNIMPYCNPETGDVYTILDEVEVYEEKMCDHHRKALHIVST